MIIHTTYDKIRQIMFSVKTFKQLLEEVKNKKSVSSEETEILERAFYFSQKAHGSQKRFSGEPYFTHPYETAVKLIDWSMDIPTICAGLLHDTVEDAKIPIDQIKKEFGEEIAFLVNGVTKLGKLKYRGENKKQEENKIRAENLRKMILAISEDLRVVFVKLADRLHNMKTLAAIPPQKQKRIALETSEIYSPLAYRLGMQNLAGELEDLAFPYLYPKEYKWLLENVGDKYNERLEYIKRVEPIIKDELQKNGIAPAKIDYRAKRYSSLYKKLFRTDMNLDQIYDLIAFRIIVNSIEECYAALGIVHKIWPPLPGKIKDYIALPKPNGYRSLHTTVFCLENKPSEFQIRTLEMHNEAENGIAAYWAYHQSKDTDSYAKNKSSFADKKELSWINQLKNWQKEFSDPQEFIKSLKIDFFKDRVFAITPKGEVIDLPAGSTPVDFAYHIHTEIGDQCVGSKINNKIVPLDYQIQSGDVVEVLTQKSKKPSESWLVSVKTENARRRIKSSIKKTSLQAPKHVEFKIITEDRVGLLKDITTIISRARANISLVNVPKTAGFPVIKIRCDLNDKEKIEKLILKLKNVSGVKEIGYKLV